MPAADIRARDIPRSCTCRWKVKWGHRYRKAPTGRWIDVCEPLSAFRVQADPMCHWHASRPAEEL